MTVDSWFFKIAGISHVVYRAPPDSHFSNVNILGSDFYIRHRLIALVGENRQMTYYIGEE